MSVRHFLQFTDFTRDEYEHLFARSRVLKDRLRRGELYQPLVGKTLAMIFEKSSTRTRVSFEAGMNQFGGHAMFLASKDTQLGRGEPIEDVARVIGRMCDIVMLRTYEQRIVDTFAAYSNAPVINGLTNEYHPCQTLADIFTYIEHRGSIEGKTVAWIGDSNNISRTWLQAAKIFNFKLRLACPKGYEMQVIDGIHYGSEHFEQTNDPRAAAEGADLVSTDVCVSMGYERESLQRRVDFLNYKVSSELMKLADKDAVFMHCLPAHRGEEVDPEVLDGPQSIVWDEAENRMHTQKALIEFLLLGRVDN
ncbi:ornithine carbamoyltransferase [Chitinimonas taiwanensis]|jgi:ornithine carbamoyltransferase|uniref:Ornithine carbamoyltransferase n=1 Tax=Chitinimonas taiwanensis DSM 18899 TaxID=1121279 RepID=A0A1K2HR69_9NEIS|nr:ornithine carbamoyltransferase [Chitinimonas taiwanensis]SFZ79205.1 ornithine carbamoyltransferase [Chitinimonas taiwanensis DSM 18899]